MREGPVLLLDEVRAVSWTYNLLAASSSLSSWSLCLSILPLTGQRVESPRSAAK